MPGRAETTPENDLLSGPFDAASAPVTGGGGDALPEPEAPVALQARGILRDARSVLAEGAWGKARRAASQVVLVRLHARLVALAKRSAEWEPRPPGVAELAKGKVGPAMVAALREVWPRLRRALLDNRLYAHGKAFAHAAATAELQAMQDGAPGILRHMNLARGPIGPVVPRYHDITYGITRLPDFDLAPPPPPLALLAGRALEGLPVDQLRPLCWGSPRTFAERREMRRFFLHWCTVATHLLRVTAGIKDAASRLRIAIAGVALAAAALEGDRAWCITSDLPRALQEFAAGRSAPAPMRHMARRLALEEVKPDDPEVARVLSEPIGKLNPTSRVEETAGTGRPINPNSQPERLAAFLKNHAPRVYAYKELAKEPALKGITRWTAVMAEAKRRYPGMIEDGGDHEVATFRWVAD